MSGPRIICLCGSTRHREAFERAAKEETLRGKIVLSVGFFGHEDSGFDMSGIGKRALDALHFRKIELADEVLILNVGGRIGLSTCDELAYAVALGKSICFLEPRLSSCLDLSRWMDEEYDRRGA